jgi:hypothetical protein
VKKVDSPILSANIAAKSPSCELHAALAGGEYIVIRRAKVEGKAQILCAHVALTMTGCLGLEGFESAKEFWEHHPL